MSASTAQTLLGVVVGAILGFVVSVGYGVVSDQLRAKKVRERLWEELNFIRSRIQFKVEHNDYAPMEFEATLFESLKG